MTCDVPVIVSQFSSLVENLEGAASLVSADDVQRLRMLAAYEEVSRRTCLAVRRNRVASP